MKKILLFLSTLLVAQNSNACLNLEGVNIYGEHTQFEGLPHFYRSFDTKYAQDYVDIFDLEDKDVYVPRELSDVSVYLCHLGRFEEALDLLIWLNEKKPDDYSITANLGTLYELNGKVDSAYHYIKKSVKLNSDSHDGSEWVHLSILKAKKEIAKDPDWLLKNNVLNIFKPILEEGKEEREKVEFERLEAIHDIGYQLRERIPFTDDPDLLLANVLRELGWLIETHASVEHAYVVYKMAEVYDPADKLFVSKNIAKILPVFKEMKYEETVLQEHFYPKNEFHEVNREYYPIPSKMVIEASEDKGEPEIIMKNNWTLIAIAFGLSISAYGFFIRRKK